MSLTSIGDLARTLIIQQASQSTRAGVNRLTAEMTSGRHSDLGARTQGNLAPLAATESALARLAAWKSATDALGLRLQAQQSALGALDGIGQAQSEALLRASSQGQSRMLDLAARDAREHLAAALGLLNAHTAGQSVFAGARPDHPAVAGADELLAGVWPVVATAATPEAAQAAIRAWFDDPAGFAAQVYRGGPVDAKIAVGPDTTIGVEVTAVDPAIKELLAGLASAALLDEGLFAGNPAAREGMTRLAGEALAGNASDRAALAARVGIGEYRLNQIDVRNTAERTALGISRAQLVTADPYDTATELEQAETRLQMIHLLTARLQGLSLLEALR